MIVMLTLLIRKAEMSSEESMTSALKGAYAVFAVTDFWSIGSYEGEVKYGKNIANAAKANGVQHLIWSSQLSVKKGKSRRAKRYPSSSTSRQFKWTFTDAYIQETNGRLTSVHHFDAKADVEEYIKSIGVPASFFWPGFYASNVSLFLRPGEDGYSMALNVSADMKLPIFDAAADTGKFVKAIVKNRDSLLGKHVLGSSGYITPEQMVADFSQVKPQAGKGAKFVQIPRDAMKDGMMKGGMPEGMSEELTQMFEWFEDPGYFAGEPLEPSLKVDILIFGPMSPRADAYNPARRREADYLPRFSQDGSGLERSSIEGSLLTREMADICGLRHCKFLSSIVGLAHANSRHLNLQGEK